MNGCFAFAALVLTFGGWGVGAPIVLAVGLLCARLAGLTSEIAA